MTGKPVVPRERAVRDVEAIIDNSLVADPTPAALGFTDTLERAYAHIGAHPAMGSPRYAVELDLPGLRSWPNRALVTNPAIARSAGSSVRTADPTDLRFRYRLEDPSRLGALA